MENAEIISEFLKRMGVENATVEGMLAGPWAIQQLQELAKSRQVGLDDLEQWQTWFEPEAEIPGLTLQGEKGQAVDVLVWGGRIAAAVSDGKRVSVRGAFWD